MIDQTTRNRSRCRCRTQRRYRLTGRPREIPTATIIRVFCRAISPAGRDVWNGDQQVTVDDSGEFTACHGWFDPTFRPEHCAETRRHCQGKRHCEKLGPIWLHWLLRHDRLFDDLQMLGLLVSLHGFAEAAAVSFLLSSSSSFLERFLLLLERIDILAGRGASVGLGRLAICCSSAAIRFLRDFIAGNSSE